MMTLLELVTTLRDRYQVYAGEYKKPANALKEIETVLGGDIPDYPGTKEECYNSFLFLSWDELVQKLLPTIEFLQHKEHFHPDAVMWYFCPDTTAAEFVVLMNECIAVLTGAKQCPSDKNNASSVSIIPES